MRRTAIAVAHLRPVWKGRSAAVRTSRHQRPTLRPPLGNTEIEAIAASVATYVAVGAVAGVD